MALSTDTALDRVISAFEDGWASGAARDLEKAPSHVEATLLEFWLDGYNAAVADKFSTEGNPTTIH